ncbi:DUF2017 domain-containing protein [Actinoalloteichus sp. AHMU CJ021]|uniref:DUF2017 domain-containing protein n=1 Tax=Actinoalloteichus caeruleus DSM 43889 TaxID=1120930 RepID=A0ABT1JI01_ACTCY|nr:DUF2017 domain-containing protein [Actinoalloteichus caeruleus]AUS78131.1 DUF2017 domain-containing protein [Actinoalloteichus sp. AHMU CJ021]MCP2332139.1 protein of unknown function (DUF2017) [Actinoalloteichus caeruleus DSM 43889]
MNGWSRRGTVLVTDFSRQEAAVLRGLVGQVHEMLSGRADDGPRDELAELTGIRTGHSTAPDDPVLRRLLPDFHRAEEEDGELSERDSDSAAALRSVHEPELLEHKTGVAQVVLDTCPESGGRIELADEQADAWLAALNDVRLALGTALDIREDGPEEVAQDDPRAPHLGVYHWLTVVQETLVEALTS